MANDRTFEANETIVAGFFKLLPYLLSINYIDAITPIAKPGHDSSGSALTSSPVNVPTDLTFGKASQHIQSAVHNDQNNSPKACGHREMDEAAVGDEQTVNTFLFA